MKWRLLPILVFFAYLNFTWALFLFGPWKYEMDRTTTLNLFIGSVHIALLLGYITGAFGRSSKPRYNLNIGALVVISALTTLAMLLPTSAARTGHVIPQIVEGITNPGTAYADSQEIRSEATGGVEYIRILLGPVMALSFPLLVFYWQQLEWRVKLIGVLAALGTVILFIAMGTNKAIADTALLIPFLVSAGIAAGRWRVSKAKLIAVACVVLLATVGFLSFFAASMASRPGSAMAAGILSSIGTSADPDHFLVRNLPPAGKIAVYGICHYLSGGYYADYLSLHEPFEWTYGFGNSTFLTRQVARIFGWNAILSRPYPNRIEKYGWKAFGYWSTLYPWLASDLSFPGVVLFMFLVGHLFAKSWIDVLSGSNPFAVLAFANFVILLLYAPANNQLLQDGEGLSAATFIFAAWLWTRAGTSTAEAPAEGE